jgi:hypothetical protein
MGGRIVAPECDADPYQSSDRDGVGRAERQHHGEDAEEHHLDDEHLLSAIPIGQAAEQRGADQDAEQ